MKKQFIQMGILALVFSVLTLIGHHYGWGVEGQRNAWLLNSTYANMVSGFFAGSGSTLICLGLPRRKNGQ